MHGADNLHCAPQFFRSKSLTIMTNSLHDYAKVTGEASSISVGTVYAVGGNNADFEMYELNDDGTWTTISIPVAFDRHGATANGKYVYAACGIHDAIERKYAYRYDVGAGSWEQIDDYPIALYYNAMCTASGTVYNISGQDGGGGYTDVYKLSGTSWVSAPSIAEKRAGHCVAGRDDGTIVVASGDAEESFGFISSTTVELFDGSSWSYVSDIPNATKHGGTAFDGNGLLHIFGGEVSNSASNQHLTYDVSSDTWGTAANLPYSTSTASAAQTDSGDIVISGGSNSAYVYRVSSDSYDQLSNLPTSPTWNASAGVGGF